MLTPYLLLVDAVQQLNHYSYLQGEHLTDCSSCAKRLQHFARCSVNTELGDILVEFD